MHHPKVSKKRVISCKSKSTRDYTASDQYTRIFMPILFIFSLLVMTFSYFNDKVNCLLTSHLNSFKESVQERCLAQGLYIYHEMYTKLNESAYYGIPKNIDHDGTTQTGHLCSTTNTVDVNLNCTPMKKIYSSQYQWVLFYMLSLASFYYFQHFIFKLANSDIMSLVDIVTNGSLRDAEKIANNYFNYKIHSKLQMQRIVWLNLVIKIIFILVNVYGIFVSGYTRDSSLFEYGVKMFQMKNIRNHNAHDIVERDTPKPGQLFFPLNGICDFYEKLHDKKGDYNDIHKVICKINHNIHYQFIFLTLWFFFTVDLFISTIELFEAVFQMIKSYYWMYYPKFFMKDNLLAKRVQAQLTLREMEYLEKIKEIDIIMYGEILRKLTLFKPDIHRIKKFHLPSQLELQFL